VQELLERGVLELDVLRNTQAVPLSVSTVR